MLEPSGLVGAEVRERGLEAGDEHIAKYRQAGFTEAYRSRHYAGQVAQVSLPGGVLPAVGWDPVEIGLYDAQAFPADRSGFVVPWLTAAGHRSFVRVVDGRLRGYGVVREAPSGLRVGPLVADSANDASALFDALTADVGNAEVSLKAPLVGGHAAALARAKGLRSE